MHPLVKWFSVLLAGLSFLFSLLALALPYWTVYCEIEPLSGQQACTNIGLWKSCSDKFLGGNECFGTPANFAGHFRATRAFVIIAMIISLVSTFFAVQVAMGRVEFAAVRAKWHITAGVQAFSGFLAMCIYLGVDVSTLASHGSGYALNVVAWLFPLFNIGILEGLRFKEQRDGGGSGMGSSSGGIGGAATASYQAAPETTGDDASKEYGATAL